MLRKGNKRGRDQGVVEANQIIWTQRSHDPKVDFVDMATNLGAFTGDNLYVVYTLNKDLDRTKE